MVQLLAILLTFNFAQAQDKKVLLSGQQVVITYGSAGWNKDSRGIDTAFIVIRDRETGKTATIQLEETEPDSAQFRGKFSLTFAGGAGATPEVYVPVGGMNKSSEVKNIENAIQTGKLQRKPVISRKTDRGPLLDVYDSKDQAETAMKAYQEELALAKQKLVKPLPSDQAMDAAKLGQMNSLAMEAAKREAERLKLIQVTKQRIIEKIRVFQGMSAADKQKSLQNAQIFAQQAQAHFNAGEFPQAEEKYYKATELDPGNNDYIYKYAIALFRTEKHNQSLVYLAITKDEPAIATEKKYYTALLHYKLKEFNQALPHFAHVAAAKDPNMSSPAMFYQGATLFDLERYEEAKKPFEEVIDNSTDPALDQSAEAYLDRIAAAIAMAEFRKKKFTLTAMGGLMYDTNVKLSQDADAMTGFGTDESDFKLMLSGDLEYRAYYTEQREWSVIGGATFMQASKTELQYTDPWMYTIAAPYSYKGILFNKGYKLTVKPGYEILNMGEAEGDTSKKNVQNSMYVNADNTFVMRKDWFAIYSLEYRMDDSKLASSLGPNNSDANKITLKTAQLFFLDDARKEAFIGTAALVMNNAKGDDKKYQRMELAALYIRPVLKDASMMGGLSYYDMNYDKGAIDRKDTNLSLTGGLSRAWSEKLTMAVNGVYSVNSSNIAANEYNKFLVMTTATWKNSF